MPSQPYGLPKWITRRLCEYDPLLRLRWGHQEGYWRVERRVKHGTDFDPRYATTDDDYEMMRDGYMIALKFRPNEMDERIFYTLWMSDMHRFKDFARMLEEDERKVFQAKRKAWGEKNEYQARDRWTSWNSSYRQGTIGRY